MNDYKFEDLRKKYQGYVVYYQDLLHLLNNIKFVTKKDGTPYQNMVKNIDISNVKLENIGVSLRAVTYTIKGGNELHFWFKDKLGRFQDYNIQLSTDFDIKNIEPSRIIKEPYLNPYYVMNLDDVKKYIEAQKKSVQEWLDKDLKILKNFDKAIAMAKKFEKEFKEKFQDSTFWYVIKECF